MSTDAGQGGFKAMSQTVEKTTLSGKLPETLSSPAPAEIDPATGMHKDYWILSERERARGFVRPVRRSYVHEVCGSMTRMADAIAETYARNPQFYSHTFCCSCRKHFHVSGFHWLDAPNEKVGS